MVRTVISLEPDEKKWLDRKASQEHVSMTQVVRTAIEHFRKSTESGPGSFRQLLAETKGIWKHGDGVKYQRKIRGEWRSSR